MGVIYSSRFWTGSGWFRAAQNGDPRDVPKLRSEHINSGFVGRVGGDAVCSLANQKEEQVLGLGLFHIISYFPPVNERLFISVLQSFHKVKIHSFL